MFCDLLIGYAYSKKGINLKAETIYNDICANAEKSAMFNIILLSKYLQAQIATTKEIALEIADESLTLIRRYNNQDKLLYALFEKLYIDLAKELDIKSVDIEAEEQKLEELKNNLILIAN